eukprot:419614-Prymnesium_polylepis.2
MLALRPPFGGENLVALALAITSGARRRRQPTPPRAALALSLLRPEARPQLTLLLLPTSLLPTSLHPASLDPGSLAHVARLL